jgi:hypothetical protein
MNIKFWRRTFTWKTKKEIDNIKRDHEVLGCGGWKEDENVSRSHLVTVFGLRGVQHSRYFIKELFTKKKTSNILAYQHLKSDPLS